jgi:HAMP domain-containing protein
MKRLNTRWPVFALLTLLILTLMPLSATNAFAQSGSAGTITGTVTDPTGAVVPGAMITIVDAGTKVKRTTVSNKSGQYVIPDVPPGTYDVTANKTGFSMDEIPSLTVSVGTQSTANFKMAVGAENTTVEVQAGNADLQTLSATTGTTVDQKLVESLPAIGRDAATFMEMQPGVTPGGMTAGTTADQTTFQLDGGSDTSDMDGTYTGYTTANTNSTTGGFLGQGPAGVVPMPPRLQDRSRRLLPSAATIASRARLTSITSITTSMPTHGRTTSRKLPLPAIPLSRATITAVSALLLAALSLRNSSAARPTYSLTTKASAGRSQLRMNAPFLRTRSCSSSS